MNTNLILISGKTATGKSLSLKNIKDPEGVLYLNCENNKALPFRSKFKQATVVDPYQVYATFEQAEEMPEVHTIIIDSVTYLMDMFETMYVLSATNTLKAWGDYAQFFKKLMSHYVAKSTKNIIFIAHTMDVQTEVGAEVITETIVKVKGSLNNNGIESYFSNVISTKKVTLKDLEECKSELLAITDREQNLGFKYVFQTLLTKKTVNERIRSPYMLWEDHETYIDNDVQTVIERLHDFNNS